MKPRPFAYRRVGSVEEACRLLAAQPDGARIIAGGQSLAAMMNLRIVSPELLVDIGGLAVLRTITADGAGLRIGALARHRDVETDPLVARHAPLLTTAIRHVAHQAVRNRGTFGGSLCHADPAAELPACALALDAEMEIATPDGPRTVAAPDFFRGAFETAIGPGEILTAVTIPPRAAPARIAFREIARRHGDFALAGVAVAAGPAADPALRWVSFGVADRPVRLRRVETLLARAGETGDAALLAAVRADLPEVGEADLRGRARLVMTAELVRRCRDDLAAAAET